MITIAHHTMPLALLDDRAAEPPSRIHLLPSGSFVGRDGRGPYRIADMAALIQASQADGPLIIDECHATDLGAVSAPAFGRIAALFGDESGLWAEVQWNKRGHGALIERDYWGVSPVFEHDASGTVKRLLRASLTNIPNLSLIALNQRQEAAIVSDDTVSEPGLQAAYDSLAAKLALMTAEQAALQASAAVERAIASGKASPAEREPLTVAFAALGLEKFQAWMDARAHLVAQTLGKAGLATQGALDPVALGHRAAAFCAMQRAKGIEIGITQAVKHCQTHREAGL